MERSSLLLVVAAAGLLIGCEGRIGAPEEEGAGAGDAAPAAVDGRAKDGRLTVKGPGVDLSIRIPDAVRERAAVDGESRVIPPGATLSGMHIQAGEDQGGGGVELGFTLPEPPARVAAWYRDPARAPEIRIRSASEANGETRLSGTTGQGGGTFTVRLRPREGGGTAGRVAISDRN